MKGGAPVNQLEPCALCGGAPTEIDCGEYVGHRLRKYRCLNVGCPGIGNRRGSLSAARLWNEHMRAVNRNIAKAKSVVPALWRQA